MTASHSSRTSAHGGAVARIDLGAICDNWRTLCRLAPTSQTAAVVKANAYGLGMVPVAQALRDAGGPSGQKYKSFDVAAITDLDVATMGVAHCFGL